MHIIVIDGKEEDGAYSVTDEVGDKILYIWEEEDDAIRFAMMLEDSGCPKMSVIGVEDEMLIKTCDLHGYSYTIITKNDFVIPPEEKI